MWFVVEEIYSNISKINVLVFKGNFAKNLKDYLLQVSFKTRNKKGKDNSSSFLIYKGSCKNFSTQFIKMIKITSVLLVFCSSFSSGHFPNCNCNFFLASMIQLGARPGYGFPYLILLLPIHKNIFQCSSVCLLFFHIKFFKF